jgi:hypothetical protein
MDNINSLTRSGDILAVIDKLESSLGWWKAMKGNKLGYIPKVGLRSRYWQLFRACCAVDTVFVSYTGYMAGLKISG